MKHPPYPGLALLTLTLTWACGAPKRDGTPEPAAEAVQYEVQDSYLIVPGPVAFETGTGTLRPESDPVLQLVAGYLRDTAYVTTLRVEGHTDATGAEAANQRLSEVRALSVARWLVAQGVDCRRLLPVGFGETKPVADNATPEGRAENRRIGFAIAGLRGVAVGGLPLDGGGRVAGDACP